MTVFWKAALLPILFFCAVAPGLTSGASQKLAASQPAAGSLAPSDRQASLAVKVSSENGVPVASAQIILSNASQRHEGETSHTGEYTFIGLTPGVFQLRVRKEGYYVATVPQVRVGATRSVDVSLNHQQELAQSVKVVYSPPMIDPATTASGSSLNTREIYDLPYTVPRDIRYALPLLPGVVQDATDQLHIDGSSTGQIVDELDGFNITDPVTRQFLVRLAPEALRSITVLDSRYPVLYGNGSGGIISMNSSMGSDQDLFSGVNFLPSIENRKGFHIHGWTPRMVFSGPIHRGRAWLLDGFDGEYRLDLIAELPPGADENKLVRFSNLSKAQINLTSSNIFTGSLLVNHLHSPNEGLSPFDPMPSTINDRHSMYILTAKDQMILDNKTLVEFGLAATRSRDAALSLGNETYVVHPGSVSGNYFETSRATSGRVEGIANVFLPAVHALGRHELEFGTDDDQISYDQSYLRNPFLIDGENGSLLQRATFLGNPNFSVRDFVAGGYAQDRWWPTSRLLVQPGIRFDWDNMVRDTLFTPRLAVSFMPSEASETKLVGGIGLYNDATNLSLITEPLDGERLDWFYDPAGELQQGPPVETSFQLQPGLREPRVWNWSAGVEHRFPGSIYLRTEYVEKRERDGWAYFELPPVVPEAIGGRYELEDAGEDRYDAIETTVRRRFKGGHILFFSYVRSRAGSNAVLDFNLENPIFGQQAGGPLAWDSPNRIVSWGLLPLWKRFDLAYTADGRTGFPFTIFNQNQQVVQSPDSRRFPAYFSVNMALERRISLFGFKWDFRAGVNDVTGRHNPFVVDDNIDSPQFLTYSSLQGRTIQAQIRLIGRK
ncbi:MAG: carboxypeptidase regulatory-like domain-containing protein [Terriglobia bacterium]